MGRILGGIAAILVAGVIATVAWLYTPDLARSDLESRYLRAPTDYVEVLDQRLHVRDEGPRDAPVIVLLHGLASSLHTWDPWAADLARDFRVVRFDLPGHGLSPPDPQARYEMERSLEVLTALLDRLGVAKATVVGNSLGGNIAWRFAALAPDRVTRLVLLDAGGFAANGYVYGQKRPAPENFKAARYVLPEAGLAKTLAPLYGDPAKLTPATLRRYWELMRAPGVRQALVDRMEDFAIVDPVPLLATLKMPVLLMWGERDILVPAALHAKAFQAAIPQAELIVYPGIGHVPMEEAPEKTLADLRAFLAKG